MAQQEKRVAVKSCNNSFEAAFMKEYLTLHGIKAWDGRERARSIGGGYGALARNVRLTVRASDAAQARALLENPPDMTEKDEALADEEEVREVAVLTEAPERCPRCGSTRVRETGLLKNMGWMLNVILLGLPLIFRRRAWACPDCDWDSNQ